MPLFLTILLIAGCLLSDPTQPEAMRTVQKNGMTVSWTFKDTRIYIEMQAPTSGWVAIGFNTSDILPKTYLLMGHVAENQVSVVEHYTLSQGIYKSFHDLKANNSIADVAGVETKSGTILRFSLPVSPNNPYARNLTEGNKYVLLLAYSREDDFQHHSMMRTSVQIHL